VWKDFLQVTTDPQERIRQLEKYLKLVERAIANLRFAIDQQRHILRRQDHESYDNRDKDYPDFDPDDDDKDCTFGR
jgi:hypothetical protein